MDAELLKFDSNYCWLIIVIIFNNLYQIFVLTKIKVTKILKIQRGLVISNNKMKIQ